MVEIYRTTFRGRPAWATAVLQLGPRSGMTRHARAEDRTRCAQGTPPPASRSSAGGYERTWVGRAGAGEDSRSPHRRGAGATRAPRPR